LLNAALPKVPATPGSMRQEFDCSRVPPMRRGRPPPPRPIDRRRAAQSRLAPGPAPLRGTPPYAPASPRPTPPPRAARPPRPPTATRPSTTATTTGPPTDSLAEFLARGGPGAGLPALGGRDLRSGA